MRIKEGMILTPNINNMDNTVLKVVQVGFGRVYCETLDGEFVGDINDTNNCDDVLDYYNIKEK